MNFKAIQYVCGLVLRFEAAFMALPLAVAIIYREYRSAAIFIGLIIAMLLISFTIAYKKPANRSFYAREGVVAVSLSWLIISFCGRYTARGRRGCFPRSSTPCLSLFPALPPPAQASYQTLRSFIKVCSFGAASRIGSEVWDMLMFITAILPMSGADPLYMMRAESPGPTKEKLVPKIRQSAAILYKIYIGDDRD